MFPVTVRNAYTRVMIWGCVCVALGRTEPADCTVTLRTVDMSGHTLPSRVISFKNAKGQEFADRFQGLRAGVPCDVSLYSFSVVRADVATNIEKHTLIRGTVAADNPETWLTLSSDPSIVISRDRTEAGSVNWRTPDGFVWRGRVTPVAGRRLWIYLRSAVSRGDFSAFEAEVDATGQFRIYSGLYPGAYVLHVMTVEGELLYTAPLRIESKAPSRSLLIVIPPSVATIVVR